MRSKKERLREIIARLKKAYPDVRSGLRFENPLECMVSTILSAQCTDARVNLVTPALFRKYPDVHAFANADQEELENDIRSTGFFRNKAKAIRKSCRMIIEKYDGVVPDTMEELVKLDGVGRKTANCVLGNAYGKPAIMVDTHVKRLSRRMGLTGETNPDKIEAVLKKLIDEEQQTQASLLIIQHGRSVCKARKPDCSACIINDLCPGIGVKQS